MHSIDHRVTFAGVIALVGMALILNHNMGRDGARNAKFFAPDVVASSNSAPMPVAAATRITAAAHDMRDMGAVGAETVIAGSEPDPEAFDQEGLERWWAKYQKAHPTN
jgi:hypothetical protein